MPEEVKADEVKGKIFLYPYSPEAKAVLFPDAQVLSWPNQNSFGYLEFTFREPSQPGLQRCITQLPFVYCEPTKEGTVSKLAQKSLRR